jgi:hypothetical protein
MAGKYPLGEIVWMYLNPLAAKNESAYTYLDSVLKSGVKFSYSGRLAIFADMKLID